MLDVEVVSPEKVLFSGEATMVTCRTVGGGDIAFLTGHVSFIGALATWPVKVVTSGADTVLAVHGGFVEVSNDKVTILSDIAELASDIDVARAERARERAMAALRDQADDEEAAAALARAEVRVQVASGARVTTSH